MTLLQVNQCSLSFGGLKALSRFHFQLEAGELVGMIGPNGAGKTTFFNLLTGIYSPTEGEILFEGKNRKGQGAYQMSWLGIARTFQNIRLFADLTVQENVLTGFHHEIRSGLWSALYRSSSYLAEERSFFQKSEDLLKIFGLADLKEEKAKNLSYGNQRKLEIVRALATQPKLLLLDEPAAGMNTSEKAHLIELIRLVHRKYQMAILLIEHDMSVVMNLCPRIVVLDYGERIAEGTPEMIRQDPKVIEAYLGVSSENSQH